MTTINNTSDNLSYLIANIETKVDSIIETIAILKLENEDNNKSVKILQQENSSLKLKERNWENSLNRLLDKLNRSDNIEHETIKETTANTEQTAVEEALI